MSLRTPERVRKLQRALYAKAKEEPDYRFYLLYDKIYREDILELAYRKCKANGGAPGVDGESFWGIETQGRERWLRELADHFQLGAVSQAYRAVDGHTRYRLRQWLRRKHQARPQGKTRYPDEYLYETLGLIRLERRTRDLPWAKAEGLVREPDAGEPHVRFAERDVETGQGSASEAPADERAGNR